MGACKINKLGGCRYTLELGYWINQLESLRNLNLIDFECFLSSQCFHECHILSRLILLKKINPVSAYHYLFVLLMLCLSSPIKQYLI
jgi:hypothetical protein